MSRASHLAGCLHLSKSILTPTHPSAFVSILSTSHLPLLALTILETDSYLLLVAYEVHDYMPVSRKRKPVEYEADMDTKTETKLKTNMKVKTYEADAEMELTTTINDYDWDDNDVEEDADFEPDPDADEQDAEIDRAMVEARDSIEQYTEMYLSWEIKWLLEDGDFSEEYLLPPSKLRDPVWSPTEQELAELDYEGWQCGKKWKMDQGRPCHGGKYSHWR
jgi:hypothetical protein